MSLCETLTLSNGLKLLRIPSRTSPVVALQGWIKFGAADETEDIAGLAHLFEHLLFKGTERRQVGAIAREIESMGGDLNAYTSYDHTVMHMTLASKHLEAGLDILADSLQHSIVDDEELGREREVVLEEIRRRNDMPGAIASDLIRSSLFGSHAYSRPVIGFSEVVANMSRETLMREYKKHYNASNLFLVVAGDFDENHLRDSCERLFSKMPPGPIPGARPSRPAGAAGASGFRHHSSPDAIVHLGWKSVGADHPDAAALDALALILGQGESSRLVRKLVNDEQLVRDTGAGCWTPKEAGSFGIVFRGPKGLAAKMPRILTELRGLLDKPTIEAELEKARKNLLSTATYSKETVDGLAERFGSCESVAGDVGLDERYQAAVRRLSIDDIERVKRQYLDPSCAHFGGIFPEGEKIPSSLSIPAAAPSRARKAAAKAGEVEKFNFRGLTVLRKPVTHLPIFSLRLAGLGGGRLEGDRQSGIGNMWARCVTEGGRASNGRVWTRDEVSEHVDRSSASLSAFHGRNSWGFSVDGLAADFDSLFELFAASLLEPSFDKEIVDQARSHVLQDIRSSDDNPSSVASRLFSAALFGKHSYGRRAQGEPAIIKKLGARDLIAYHRKMLAQPMVLTVVGDIERETLEATLEKFLGAHKFARTSKLLKRTPAKAISRDVAVGAKLPKEQTHILLGFPSCTLFEKDRWALLGLSAVLSGQGGRLFLELRDKLSLCYTVAPTHMEGFDAGYFGFYIATAPDKRDTALAALRREIDRLCDEGLPEDEWKSAQRFYVGNHEIEQQRLGGQAMGMALDEVYGLGWKEHFEFAKKLESVKAADVVRVARKYLRGASVVSQVGPK